MGYLGFSPSGEIRIITQAKHLEKVIVLPFILHGLHSTPSSFANIFASELIATAVSYTIHFILYFR